MHASRVPDQVEDIQQRSFRVMISAGLFLKAKDKDGRYGVRSWEKGDVQGKTKKNVLEYKYSITTSAACLILHVLSCSCMCTSRMANRKKLSPSKLVQKSMPIRGSFRAVHGVDDACTSSKQEQMMISEQVHDSISSINQIDLLPINNDFFLYCYIFCYY